jgi:hypothetical protein
MTAVPARLASAVSDRYPIVRELGAEAQTVCAYGTTTTFPVTWRAAMSFNACAVSANA